MIRPIEDSDRDIVLEVAIESGLFEPSEIAPLAEILDRFLASSNDKQFWMVDDNDDGVVVGVTYLAHESMTLGTWNMLMLAVNRDRQGQGRGSALVKHSENLLKAQGHRMLLVETAGVEAFEQVRQFYEKNGFTREGIIRDFYEQGVDKVVFRKMLR